MLVVRIGLMSEPPYGSLQWQKQQLSEWILGLWLQAVPIDRSKAWIDRLSMQLTDAQVADTIQTLEGLSGQAFGPWLLDEAEPWQQSLLLASMPTATKLDRIRVTWR